MRLARVGLTGAEVPVAGTTDGNWYDLREITQDIDGSFLSTGPRHAADAVAGGRLPTIGAPANFRPPIVPGKVVCIGLNYRAHATETGAPFPTEPIIFLKTADTVVGCDDEVLIPRNSAKTDYEVELAVVIGSEAKYLGSLDDAPAVIAGYAISNDVSERAFQLERGGQWDKGKNCATFNPLGPWILTADDVGDPQQLAMRLSVNGELRQDSTTADMIFGINHLVWYTSQFMTLHPGDVINTGTPPGVAMGRPDTPYLREGDIVELEIENLGRQRQKIGQA